MFYKKGNKTNYPLFFICVWGILAGCSISEKVFHFMGMGFSHIKSPISVTSGQINEPMNTENCQELKNVSFAIRKGINREKALASFNKSERVDTFQDLFAKKNLIFVCISGGGSRASALASHTLSLLEKTYNRERTSKNFGDIHKLIDTYSSVSGGAIYSSYLALYYKETSKKKNTPEFFQNLNQKLQHIRYCLYMVQ